MTGFLALPNHHCPQIPLGMGPTPADALAEAMAWTDGNVLVTFVNHSSYAIKALRSPAKAMCLNCSAS